ncbi:uncharacterized protein PHACADRAFT_160711 [Phanerochaete carnosa HHB-10118-sp]|uniref:Tail specific protease domain-containing protein n=1 Tax=Phanerochaete carnosa (strain HHB-10118-sp) TaxID=650164 RepID=K5V3M3_PHACS|nr:uncharacterized protein PHACADRAFT_160711 [Phanerochaete carnosa HHB-10118-sp]EKM57181.1 hypothetical protein PHACADRAFT_160711 [Phanerochaete carnosa HHB-10118-sp]
MRTRRVQAILSAVVAQALFVKAAPAVSDPCAIFAGQTFVAPSQALACLKSFPFNETLRQNVLTVISRVFDFYTFEDFYLNSPPPFQESTTNIRADIARINSTKYETDYDFNRAVYNFTTQMNDGHTRWLPSCYQTFQNLLPAPVVTLEDENGVQNVFVAPDSVEFVSLLGDEFTGFFDQIGFDWKRLAGARVLEIDGMDAYAYADLIASTETGNYLDHGVRVNSVFSSYRISDTDFSQRFGDIAGPAFPDRDSLTMTLIPVGSTQAETVTVPYLADYLGANFTDQASFWEVNCAANNETNGVDLKTQLPGSGSALRKRDIGRTGRKLARAAIVDKSNSNAVGLPQQFIPTLSPVNGSTGVIKSFILPSNKTGVMFVGSFEGDFNQFQTDTDAAIKQFKASGVTRLLVDLTNNGGGFVCLGQFLHQYLVGTTNLGNAGNPGFQSTNRGNTLAKKIVASDIALGLNDNLSFYTPDNWAFLNNTEMPLTHNYINPSVPFTVNGVTDQDSQRFFDTCDLEFVVEPPEESPFDLNNVAIVSNGDCASTCAMFSTLMFERHQTKVAVFGGKPGEQLQYKGMAGNQVLEWTDIDNEIKTANLKDDPLAPPDLLVNADFRHNWRTAWSFFNEQLPIAYVSELPQFRFPYTNATYNNPEALWTFAESKLFS